MIAAQNLWAMTAGGQVGDEGFADKKIVDAPTDIAWAAVIAIAPPSVVMGGIGMAVAEGIDKALLGEVV